ncbi:hypothetical protein HPP92_012977 [Vanilla planifolia]|uniref:Large ribosomal subunit protein uL6 alpha-beta domain-containing protein n=1 Tax=Vanilla planifolia TaxID=51239 RepID=A0A835QMJ6_VANPL|nr:hypothetical protein HPP92_012977 [Vanilla planifolia]
MEIPGGVTVKVKAKIVEVEGPRGKLTRSFKHLNLDFELMEGGKKLKVDAWFGSRKSMAAIRTAISHVQNLITGVTKGEASQLTYTANISYTGLLAQEIFDQKSLLDHMDELKRVRCAYVYRREGLECLDSTGKAIRKNKVRKVDMLDGVSIVRLEKVKDELILDGNDIELVSRSAALINQKCHVKNKDIRKFLDGIYVSEKGNIADDQ